MNGTEREARREGTGGTTRSHTFQPTSIAFKQWCTILRSLHFADPRNLAGLWACFICSLLRLFCAPNTDDT